VIGFNPDNCSIILEALYDISKANTNSRVYLHAIANTTKVNLETLTDCVSYLESKGFLIVIRPKPTNTNFDLISITREGIYEVGQQKQNKQISKTFVNLNQHHDNDNK
jgi:hypothetical protein